MYIVSLKLECAKIFNAVADVRTRMECDNGRVNIIYHYIGDFILLDPSCSKECDINLQKLKLACKDLTISLISSRKASCFKHMYICIKCLGLD